MHCWGERGRTGTAFGCYLVESGMTDGPGALERIKLLTSREREVFRRTPERDEQEILRAIGGRPLPLPRSLAMSQSGAVTVAVSLASPLAALGAQSSSRCRAPSRPPCHTAQGDTSLGHPFNL